MALPITGGGVVFPQTIADLVGDDDTWLEAAFPYINIEECASVVFPDMVAAWGDRFGLIAEKGHIILTCEDTDPDDQALFAADWIDRLNFCLVG